MGSEGGPSAAPPDERLRSLSKEVVVVRSSRDLRRTAGWARSVRWVGAVGVAVAAATPLAAAASEAESARVGRAAAPGVVYGGLTPQSWPVVVEVSKDKRKVVTASIGLLLTCTSGLSFGFPDGYRNVPLSKKGRFTASFGPTKLDHPDGTSTDLQGSVTGAMNSKRTTMSGTWQVIGVDHDAAGVVTDTCDSGKVAWKAKQ
jgi:hypothetical protein